MLRNNFQTAYHLHEEEAHDGKVVRLVLSEETSFLNKASISSTLADLPGGIALEIDGSRAKYIDYDVLEIIHNFATTAKLRNIRLTMTNIPAAAVAAAHH